MPINIPNDLPAWERLSQENIFIMSETCAAAQDIRPLRILILNLMPKKIDTERQLLRMLSNTPLQVDVELLQTATHASKNTAAEHLLKFYKVFDDVKEQYFDGMIITGAPVEHLEFEEVGYWDELCQIMEWSKSHDTPPCTSAGARRLPCTTTTACRRCSCRQKMFGVFPHTLVDKSVPLLRGFDEIYWMPHSRHTEIPAADIRATGKLYILSSSPIAGVNIVSNHNGRQIFIFGHSEYEANTLADEYFRDLDKGLPIQLPYHYFPDDDPAKKPIRTWRSHGYLFYSNWLNYYVYQSTPYDLGSLRLDPLV